MKRRKFIHSSLLTATAVAVSACKKEMDILKTPCIQNTISKKIIIIGSGYGGSVCAASLTQAGHEVMLLERGKRWNTDGVTSVFSAPLGTDKESTWLSTESAQPFLPSIPIFNKYYIGVAEKIKHKHLTTVSAACYGGGSIISGGIMLQPDKSIFTKYFPTEINFDDLDMYYSKVRQQLNITDFDNSLLSHPNYYHNILFKNHNENIDVKTVNIQSEYDAAILQEEIMNTKKPSAIIGQSVFGSDSGVKNSLDKTYLAQAESSGKLEVKTQFVVREIGENCDNKYYVSGVEIDETGNTIKNVTYTCDYLFVCSGAIHSSKLFTAAKAKNTLTNLNEHIGAGFGNNGNSFIIRGSLADDTGSTQAFPPLYGAQDFSDIDYPLFIEHFPFSFGLELKSLGYNIMSINRSNGYFKYNKETDNAELIYPSLMNSDQKNINQKVLEYAKKLNIANGGKLSSFLGASPKSDVTYHPLGGMVITKATDDFGRVKNKKNLYVQDGSLMPGHTACTNPALTIAAIVERNIEHILNNDF